MYTIQYNTYWSSFYIVGQAQYSPAGQWPFMEGTVLKVHALVINGEQVRTVTLYNRRYFVRHRSRILLPAHAAPKSPEGCLSLDCAEALLAHPGKGKHYRAVRAPPEFQQRGTTVKLDRRVGGILLGACGCGISPALYSTSSPVRAPSSPTAHVTGLYTG